MPSQPYLLYVASVRLLLVGLSHTFNIQNGNNGLAPEVLAFCTGLLSASQAVSRGETFNFV
jgi:hypothetical protein